MDERERRRDGGSAPVVIRPPADADSEVISGLLAELGYQATAHEIPERLAALAAPSALTAHSPSANVDGSARAMVRLAEIDGAVIGLITAHLLVTLHAPAPVAWITALVIAKGARRSGAGRELVRHAEAWAREGGAGRIAVTSGAQRADAHAFYRRIGYAETGVRFGRQL